MIDLSVAMSQTYCDRPIKKGHDDEHVPMWHPAALKICHDHGFHQPNILYVLKC